MRVEKQYFNGLGGNAL